MRVTTKQQLVGCTSSVIQQLHIVQAAQHTWPSQMPTANKFTPTTDALYEW